MAVVAHDGPTNLLELREDHGRDDQDHRDQHLHRHELDFGSFEEQYRDGDQDEDAGRTHADDIPVRPIVTVVVPDGRSGVFMVPRIGGVGFVCQGFLLLWQVAPLRVLQLNALKSSGDLSLKDFAVKEGILARMANKFQQRKVMLALDDLEKRSITTDEDREELLQTAYKDDGSWCIRQERLLKYLCHKYPTKGAELSNISRWKKVINSCESEGFIKRDSTLEGVVRFRQDMGKLYELEDWRYFWFKHVPGELPVAAQIGVSAATALLTSGALWKLLS